MATRTKMESDPVGKRSGSRKKSWGDFFSEPSLPSWVRKTLALRAAKRVEDVSILGDGEFIVAGRPQDGDSFPEYHVQRGDRWGCSCQSHSGGQYRGVCSHIVACMLAEQARPWRVLSEVGAVESVRESVTNGIMERDPFFSESGDGEVEWDPFFAEGETFFAESTDDSATPGKIGAGIEEQTQTQAGRTGDGGRAHSATVAGQVRGEREARTSEASLPLTAGYSEASARPEATNNATKATAKATTNSASQEATGCPRIEPNSISTQTPALDLGALKRPSWCPTLRKHQVDALIKIHAAFSSGKRNIILEAPTGAGKTLIGAMAAQIMQSRMLYVCTTKSLQDQFLADFPSSRDIKGRKNYPTALKPFPLITAEDCDFSSSAGCSHCPSNGESPSSCKSVCPYAIAKRKAEFSDIAVLNTAYFLGALNSAGSRWDNVPGFQSYDQSQPTSRGFSNRGLSVFDEADELESCLMSHVELVLSARAMRELNVVPPDPNYSRWPDRLRWLSDDVIPAVEQLAEAARKIGADKEDRRWTRVFEQVGSVISDISSMRGTDELMETWIYDLTPGGTAIFKPVRVAKFGEHCLFRHSRLNLIMSATIVAPEQFAADIGLDWSETEFIQVPSTFDKDRRPIFLTPVANVTAKEMDAARPKLGAKISQIAKDHPNDRILVHTVSYDLSRWLYLHLRPSFPDRVVTYDSSQDRDSALERYRKRPGSIMLAPSLDRGINLKDDDCRIVIVAKNPWPNKGDKQIKRRLYQPTKRDGELWYRCQALRTVIQMTGRGMRSERDWCKTYILDMQFIKLFAESKHLLPEWWREAVLTTDREPEIFQQIKREVI